MQIYPTALISRIVKYIIMVELWIKIYNKKMY